MNKKVFEQIKQAAFNDELMKIAGSGSALADIAHNVARTIPRVKNALAKKLGITDDAMDSALLHRDPKEQEIQNLMGMTIGDSTAADTTMSGYRILNKMYPYKGG